MSGRGAFLSTLREIEREMALPIPERVRILRELEFDLEELRSRFIGEGLGAEEARERAIEALVPEGPAMQELDRLHQPAYARLTEGVRDDRLRLIERTALAVATATVLLPAAGVLARTDVLRAPSPFLWPVLGLGVLVVGAAVAKAFELWIKGDHRRPERGVSAILGLAVAAPALAVTGAFVETYRLAARLQASPALASTLAPEWLVRTCTLLSVSILVALTGALAWFVLNQWLTLVVEARREALGMTTRLEQPEQEMTR